MVTGSGARQWRGSVVSSKLPLLRGHPELCPAGSTGNSVGWGAGVWTHHLPGCYWLRAAARWGGDCPPPPTAPPAFRLVLLLGRTGLQCPGRLRGVYTEQPYPGRKDHKGMGWGRWLTASATEATSPAPPNLAAAPYRLLGDVTSWARPATPSAGLPVRARCPCKGRQTSSVTHRTANISGFAAT